MPTEILEKSDKNFSYRIIYRRIFFMKKKELTYSIGAKQISYLTSFLFQTTNIICQIQKSFPNKIQEMLIAKGNFAFRLSNISMGTRNPRGISQTIRKPYKHKDHNIEYELRYRKNKESAYFFSHIILMIH